MSLKVLCKAADILQQLEKDAGSRVCVNDSSSDDEDLVHPANTENGDDLDWTRPISDISEDDEDPDYVNDEEDEDDEDPDFFNDIEDPDYVNDEEDEDDDYNEPPLVSNSGPSTSAALPPTRKRKRGISSLGNSPASKKPGKRKLTSTESEDEDRWHDREEKDIKPGLPRFKPARIPGPTFDTTKPWTPISLFQLFFSASVVRKIIENTNANAAKRKQAGLGFKWEVLTVKEFYTFLSIIIFTGLVKVHHRSDYWRKKWPYNFPFPSENMSRDRFEAILWSLHLSNPKEDEENEKKRNTAEYDRLFKIKPLYTEIVDACKAHFQPYQNLSIDERMVASKACISMKQYIKDKPTKWGYKLVVLADSSIGYTWNFFVYTGNSESPTGHSRSYSAVMDLLPFSLLGSGYRLYTDNFYTSPTLFTDLSTKNISCCGTIRSNRIVFTKPKTNDLPIKAERGDMRWLRSGKLLFVKWMDARQVTMCSTLHEAYTGQTVRRKVKEAGVWKNKDVPVPDCIGDYNKNMGGVDLSDALIGFYSVRHKTAKWYKTFFYHFVDIAVVNSFLLYKELFKFRHDPTKTKLPNHKAFREQLAKEMLEFAQGSAAIPPPRPPTTCMPVFYDNEETRTRKHCKRCHNAGMPRTKTGVYCRRCEVPLCLSSKKNCFQLWHDGQ